MNRLSLTSITGTAVWAACAVKVFGYVWETYSQTYDKSAFAIGKNGSGGVSDVPIVPPLKRKDKPGGGKTRLPRLSPFPKIPPVPVLPGTGPEPTPSPATGSPWDTVTEPGFSLGDVLKPGRWLPDLGGFLGFDG